MNDQPLYPIVLTILDGWGYSEHTKGNAIKLAATPTIDEIWKKYPHTLLNASGKDVGLPDKQMGNSEVGHTTIGAGRIINQDLVRISKAIENKTFFKNQVLKETCDQIQNLNSQLHLIGLCSDGGVHSHIDHLIALINFIKQYSIQTCIHIITDGRDTQPNTSTDFIKKINQCIENSHNINICTISGRYYGMDRDCRWSRTEKTYEVLINDTINDKLDYINAINKSYKENIFDEFITPIRIHKGSISDNDGIIFFNFRPDRIRQLLHCFANHSFQGFMTKTIHNLKVVTFTQYDSNLPVPVVFPPQEYKHFIGEIISNHRLKQFRVAETEKYAHVTYFFNGGIEEPFTGEDRELISSPKVDTYDLAPNMSAHELTNSIIKAIKKKEYEFIVINYANPDMVGHTGNLNATIEAITVIDQCIKKLLQEILTVNGTLIITADHGNADYMINTKNQPCTSHSTNLVPFMLITNHEINSPANLRPYGCLADIAPTILNLLNIYIPHDMSGISLLENK